MTDAARQLLLDAAVVVPHTDADGLAAGAIALRARGETAADALLLGRGQVPWDRELPSPPAILDWGMRAFAGPALVVDHHHPEAEPGPGQLLVTGDVPTGPLMRRLVPEAPAWLAAVGAVGDAGREGLALPECAGAPKTAVTKLVPLVNAPRRLPDGPVREALALLVESESPQAALADPRIGLLREAKDAWRAEFDRVVRTAPQVGDRIALIRFSTPAQVHPLVALTWSRRLAPKVVLAANDDYLPGRVNFAVRGGPEDLDLLRMLREALPGDHGEFAHGHAKATGGSLPPEAFAALLAGLA
jgi:single-stranded-DNA-specific exonuclease